MNEKFKSLGKVLSKQEQKLIKGGIVSPGQCIETSGCTDDSKCGDGTGTDCVCGTFKGEKNNHCIKLT
ncbi:MAG: hypothetical protein IT214_14625 [Chitinophagaceae bacterium]|jgi:hypothetical protein|nr:hypothetical protein [Chitinophagaceae bacterium]OQY93468.1 MAG: hypothetical protein B6D37_11680 [Sphingobacteriales bacterium UTBCD1]